MLKTKIAIISNLWTKMISLEKGDVHKGHSHTFDHTHLLTDGKVKVTIEGVETIFTAPTQIFIKKDFMHSMECLSEKSLGWCIHPIRDGNRIEDIVDPAICPDYTEDTNIYPDTALLYGVCEETEPKPWKVKNEHDNPEMAETQ